MLICLQNCLNFSNVKFVPTSEMIFLGSPCYANILAVCTKSSTARLPTLNHGECALVIYNVQKHFVINHEHVSTNQLLWSACYFIRSYSHFELCLLVLQVCGALPHSIFSVCIHIDPKKSLPS